MDSNINTYPIEVYDDEGNYLGQVANVDEFMKLRGETDRNYAIMLLRMSGIIVE